MKIYIIFVVVIGAAIGDSLTDEERKQLLDAHNNCIKKTGVDERITIAALGGNFSDDPKFNNYLTCFNEDMGFMDSNGKLQMDPIKNQLGKMLGDTSIVDKVASKCVVEKENPEETSFEMAKCLHAAHKELF